MQRVLVRGRKTGKVSFVLRDDGVLQHGSAIRAMVGGA
jgi:hypothetical protein